MNEPARQGVPDNYLQVLKSYLSNRWASLELATGKRVEKQITKGCTQGSRSRPGYWKILYGTLFEEQLSGGCEITAFADDTMLSVKSATYKGLLRAGADTLEANCRWADKRKLQFNPTKTEALFFGKRPGQDRPTMIMRGVRVRCKTDMRYLGVIIDDKMSWKPHIKQACDKAKTMHQLGRRGSHMPHPYGKTVAKSENATN